MQCKFTIINFLESMTTYVNDMKFHLVAVLICDNVALITECDRSQYRYRECIKSAIITTETVRSSCSFYADSWLLIWPFYLLMHFVVNNCMYTPFLVWSFVLEAKMLWRM